MCVETARQIRETDSRLTIQGSLVEETVAREGLSCCGVSQENAAEGLLKRLGCMQREALWSCRDTSAQTQGLLCCVCLLERQRGVCCLLRPASVLLMSFYMLKIYLQNIALLSKTEGAEDRVTPLQRTIEAAAERSSSNQRPRVSLQLKSRRLISKSSLFLALSVIVKASKRP